MALHGLWNTTRQIILEPEDINEPLGGWGGPTHKKLILPATENYRKHIILFAVRARRRRRGGQIFGRLMPTMRCRSSGRL